MNRDDATRFLHDLLTDYHSDRMLGLCKLTGEDADAHRDEVAEFVGGIDLDAVVLRVFDRSPDKEYALHEWADLDQIRAVCEQHLHPRSPVPTPLDMPCPEWCDKPDGHPFERYAKTTRREHVHRFGDRGSSVRLEQIERSPDPTTGITDLGIDPAATVIRVQYGPGQTGYVTSAGARRLATQLMAAADLHDKP